MTKPTRILHVTECVGGGVARAIDQIPGAAPEAEHYLLSVRPEIQRPSGNGFRRMEVMPEGHIQRVRALRRMVSAIQPDIVHAHSSWAGFYVRATGIPAHVVYQPHGYAFGHNGRTGQIPFATAEWLLAQRWSSVAVLSPHEDELARRLNPRSRRIFVPNASTVTPSRLLHTERLRRVVMIGRLSAQKDPRYFASLKNMVSNVDPSVEFRWIGDGEPATRIALEQAGVHVTGWLDDSALVAELNSAALYAHSARYEGFPLSVLDAASCGLPITARAIPAFNGSPVAQFGSLAQHASAVVEYFSGPTLGDDLIRRSSALLLQMNGDQQRLALSRLYDLTGIVKAWTMLPGRLSPRHRNAGLAKAEAVE